MSQKKNVTTKSGNYYQVSESNGWFWISRNGSVGKTRSLQDALELIKSLAGSDIKSIS